MIANAIIGMTDVAAKEYIALNTSSGGIWIMKIAMMIFPLICILIGFILYSKKFKIDEKLYAEIISDLETRAENNGADKMTVSVGAENEA